MGEQIMSGLGWSLPAGVSTLPGEEGYYCPICGAADFTGVIDDSWPDGLPGQEEYCSINCAKAAQLGYKKEIKSDDDGNWNTTGNWINANSDPVPLIEVIRAGIDVGAQLCNVLQEDINVNDHSANSCPISNASTRLFGKFVSAWYDSIVVERGPLGFFIHYKNSPRVTQWMMDYDSGRTVQPITLAFMKEDMYVDIV